MEKHFRSLMFGSKLSLRLAQTELCGRQQIASPEEHTRATQAGQRRDTAKRLFAVTVLPFPRLSDHRINNIPVDLLCGRAALDKTRNICYFGRKHPFPESDGVLGRHNRLEESLGRHLPM